MFFYKLEIIGSPRNFSNSLLPFTYFQSCHFFFFFFGLLDAGIYLNLISNEITVIINALKNPPFTNRKLGFRFHILKLCNPLCIIYYSSMSTFTTRDDASGVSIIRILFYVIVQPIIYVPVALDVYITHIIICLHYVSQWRIFIPLFIIFYIIPLKLCGA